jgi:hypothetical protein
MAQASTRNSPEPTITPTTVTAPQARIREAVHAYANLVNWQQCARRGSNVRTVADMERTQSGVEIARARYLKSVEGLNDEQRAIVSAAFRGNLAGLPPDTWDRIPDPVSAEWIAWAHPPFVSEF